MTPLNFLHSLQRTFCCIFIVSILSCNPGTPPPNTAQPSNPWGIQWYKYVETGIRESNGRFTGGKIKDVIEIDANSVLAAAAYSGAWFINSSVAIPLSHDWEHPDMKSVEHGEGRQYFAGGMRSDDFNAGALYTTDISADAPLVSRWHPISLTGIARINDVLYVPQRKLLFLATNNGIWYSSVPSSPGGRDYNFRMAQMPAGAGVAFENIIRSGATGIVASQSANGITSTLSGVYTLNITADPDFNAATAPVLAFETATLNGLTNGDGRCIFLSAISSMERVVAMVGNARGEVEGLYSSTDAGRIFNKINGTVAVRDGTVSIGSFSVFGGRGPDWCGTVAINPSNPDMIAFAAANGPYISTNGGRTFKALRNTGIHQDYGRLLFSSFTANRLICATDGGVSHTGDAANFLRGLSNNESEITQMNNDYNKRLSNLLFLSPTGRKGFWGNIANKQGGWIAGGLQDNDNVIVYGADQPWVFSSAAGNDGGGNGFSSAGLFSQDANGGITDFTPYSGVRLGTATAISVRPAPGLTTSYVKGPFITMNFSDIVNASGARLCGFSSNAEGPDPARPNVLNNIYGLFSTATNATAEYLFNIPLAQGEIVSCLYSDNGNKVLIGTRGGAKIFVATRNSDGSYTVTLSNRSLSPINFVNEIGKIVSTGRDGYAAIENQANSSDVLISQGGENWTSIRGNLPAGTIFSIAAYSALTPVKYFVAMDNGVYATNSLNGNNTQWIKVSTGLPAMPHCTDLVVGTNFRGVSTLFLGTFGNSLWATDIEIPQ